MPCAMKLSLLFLGILSDLGGLHNKREGCFSHFFQGRLLTSKNLHYPLIEPVLV